jgi:ATP-dependent DNA helicase RecG
VAEIRDSSGALPVVWFQQPYLVDQLPSEEDLVLHGRVARRGDEPILSHPRWELAAAGAPGLFPLYPPLPEVGDKLLRRCLGRVLDAAELESELADPLPVELRRLRGLPSLARALREVHRPGPEADPVELASWRSPAQLRLIYGELFAHQLELASRALGQRRRCKPHRYRIDDGVRERARRALPFALTGAQKRVLKELVADLRSPAPMRRLLQGDVGSGKTVVAALLLLIALESGLQGVLLAPTELLAEQHLETFRALLGPEIPMALVTSSAATSSALAGLRRGEVGIAVGTHALLQEHVALRRLGLVIIDEQHRFGVAQRRLLVGKGRDPDLLVMSATPIPRSLAMTLYGDLDVSILDELPPGRRPVVTEVAPAAARRQVYERLRETLERGGQAYVVVPRIAEGEEEAEDEHERLLQAEGGRGRAGDEGGGRSKRERGASLEGLGSRLLEHFSDFPCAALHGRMPAAERDRVMEALRSGQLRLLIATTVIEVGVDVPGATAMVIESAERFGLAQLHQLRGRVGRGEGAAWCAALHGEVAEEARRRLTAFAETTDGFALAEADLALRGPGDLLGRRQAGEAPFRWADLVRDREWLELARSDARHVAARSHPR